MNEQPTNTIKAMEISMRGITVDDAQERNVVTGLFTNDGGFNNIIQFRKLIFQISIAMDHH